MGNDVSYHEQLCNSEFLDLTKLLGLILRRNQDLPVTFTKKTRYFKEQRGELIIKPGYRPIDAIKPPLTL